MFDMERTLTMAMSPLEIVEDDCGTDSCIEITVFSNKHAESLIGKYYRDPNVFSTEWHELDFETAKSFINRKIQLRSPMTCGSENFKMCRTCFGNKNLPTKYMGIVAAQVLSERLTQLIMRSFHTSGSASLDYPESVKKFLTKHLVDIKNYDDRIELYCNSTDYPTDLKNIKGFNTINDNVIIFKNIADQVINKDAVSVMLQVKDLLKSQGSVNKKPQEYYEEMMSCILEVGCPYSSFVEMLFANMFVCDKEKTQFWRYNQNLPILQKLGDKTMARNISKLLGLLYQPNKRSLEGLSNITDIDLNGNTLNIYEKIWLGLLD